ncbi:NAD(P)-dependent oxidoreductase [Bradyrhizobium sp. LHD-71]|uniref:NAD-dependent epimerase/dehydratase family protein n=1 Tax=Bradyrhizobium sp. LHD-71 TaxID=3072141 RepID=UPI00280E345C|nr:NAD(P)-dependent oxidoreductase [Bradyrhizobium sp. LHD-71]MDQ8730884.1 NAD(P)-dependent oxidoreductase [Bradyrhizobium sp. LHD-71]
MATLVTGASGFVGAALCEELVTRGERVIGLDRTPPAAEFLTAIAGAPGNFSFIALDLKDHGALARVFADHPVDRVVIGAAITADQARERIDPSGIIAVNIGSVVETIRCAAGARVSRVVYLSSGAAYGASAREVSVLTETSPLKPTSLYGITKQAGEACALRLGETFGMEVVVGRLGTCYGRFERATGVRDTLSAPFQVIRLACEGVPASLPRPAPRDWLYARDAAAAIAAVLYAPQLPHRVYNLAADFRWSLADLCARLETVVPGWRWMISTDSNVNLYEDFDRAPMGIDRLMADTSFRPQYDLAKAFAEIVADHAPLARFAPKDTALP